MNSQRNLSSSSLLRSFNDSFESDNNENKVDSDDEMNYNSSKYKKIAVLTDLNTIVESVVTIKYVDKIKYYNDYKLIKPLGEGSLCKVKLVEKDNIKYALKIINKNNLLKKKKFQNNKNEIEKIEKNIFSINDGNLENNNNNSGENKIFQRRKLRSITHSGKDNQSFRSKLYFSQENSKKNLQRFYITNNENKPILLNINNSNNFVNANNNSISNSGSNNNLKTYLLYKASIDGFDSIIFHNKCDNIKGTLILIENNNYSGCEYDFEINGWEQVIECEEIEVFNVFVE